MAAACGVVSRCICRELHEAVGLGFRANPLARAALLEADLPARAAHGTNPAQAALCLLSAGAPRYSACGTCGTCRCCWGSGGWWRHCGSTASSSGGGGLGGSGDDGLPGFSGRSLAGGRQHRNGGLPTSSPRVVGWARGAPLPLTATPPGARHLHGSANSAAAAAGGGGRGCRTEPPPPMGPSRTAPRDEGLGAPMEVFDRSLKALHRDRSSRLLDGADPLLAAVSERLLDRLEDCRRGFPTAVVLGGAAVPVVHQLAGGRAGIERVIVVDPSQAMLDRIQREAAGARSRPGAKPWPRLLCVRGDEESLPLRDKSVDLIISCLGLHWANDLPGAMAQCRAALVPDGLFLAALLGGDTLQELRISCALAQMERQGGVSAVVSPFAQVRDAGNLLTRADLRLPSVDVDRFTLGYPSPMEVVQHLRALGESNAATQRRRVLSRDSALAAAAVYQSMFGGQDGSVSATYEVIFMTGWAPSSRQPKAAKRGSATVSFQELADGLVSEGKAIGGTADGGVVTPEGVRPGADGNSGAGGGGAGTVDGAGTKPI